jgi:hypothetical protein
MNVILIILLILSAIVILSIKIKFHRKKIKICKDDRAVSINDVVVEYSDLQHYIDTSKEFEGRKTIIDTFIDPIVDIEENQTAVAVPDIINHHIREDVQNVHDSTIQKNIQNTFLNASKTQQAFSKTEVLDYIKDDTKREKVSGILDKIITRNGYVTNLNSSEEDVIKNVWFSGDENVKEQVINELLDCIDSKGVLYCPTGVTARISSALHINNPDNSPKTKELLNQEVMATFGKKYNDLPDKTLAKEKTIEDYYQVYDRQTISNLIDEWIDYV